MNPRKPKIIVLCVDLPTVRSITSTLMNSCDLRFVRDARGLATLVSDEPTTAAVLVDIAVPQTNAIECLQNTKNTRETIRRILISDYCDLGIIVQGLHTGAVQQIVYKPVHNAELLSAVGISNPQAIQTTIAPQQVARVAG